MTSKHASAECSENEGVCSTPEDAPLNSSCVLIAPPDSFRPHSERIQINSGNSFYFESELFRGEAQLFCSGSSTTPVSLFSGMKRKSWFIIRGKFKQCVNFDDVLIGQEFTQPLSALPGLSILGTVMSMATALNPTYQYQLTPHPVFLTKLVATAQIINIARKGEEVSLMEAKEDMRLIGGEGGGAYFTNSTDSGDPLPATQRKRLMSQSKNRKNFVFDSDHIWTFHFWQHVLDLERFELDIRIKRISLLPILNGQPLRLMARHQNGTRLWDFALVHRDLHELETEPNTFTNTL
eukprot:g3274.t1